MFGAAVSSESQESFGVWVSFEVEARFESQESFAAAVSSESQESFGVWASLGLQESFAAWVRLEVSLGRLSFGDWVRFEVEANFGDWVSFEVQANFEAWVRFGVPLGRASLLNFQEFCWRFEIEPEASKSVPCLWLVAIDFHQQLRALRYQMLHRCQNSKLRSWR
jgi:hypothetical protein